MRHIIPSLIIAGLLTGIGQVWGADLPKGVTIEVTPEGPIFTAHGMTLYHLHQDLPGISVCTDKPQLRATNPGGFEYPVPDLPAQQPCTQKWPPLRAEPNATAFENWSVIKRDDGTSQWAYDGRPLYTSSLDKHPGETNGVPVGARYYVTAQAGGTVARAPIDLPAGVLVSKIASGLALTTAKGDPLYTLDSPKGKRDRSEKQWAPLLAPAIASKMGDWSVNQLSGGLLQWAYRGRPVYTAAAADLTQGGEPILLQKLGPRPKEIGERRLPFGNVYTDSDGMTLYILACYRTTPVPMSCHEPGDTSVYVMALCGGMVTGDCSKIFQPLAAGKGAKPVSPQWSIVSVDPRNPTHIATDSHDSVRAWAYYGKPVYRFVGDKVPGDFKGHSYSAVQGGWYVLKAYGEGAGES
jgi:predicted lipoprotein with Yx(FWY)xxD motif